MALNINRLDSIRTVNRNQWNQVVEQSHLGRVYHRYRWLQAVELGTPYQPKHLLVSKKGNPVAVLPNFVIESDRMPFQHLVSSKPGPGGPIAMTDEEEAIQLLLDAVPELCDISNISHQIQTFGPEYSRYHRIFEENGYDQRLVYCDFVLDISRDWDDIFADMDSSRRYDIKQGHENDFEIVDKEITEQTMSDFFEGYSTVMDRVGGRKSPRRFFLELCELSERLKLFAVRVDGEERGAMLYTLDDEQSTIHSESSAVTRDNFEYHSNELIHEHAIKWGKEHGYDTYSFGGTELDFRDGVFRYKEKFGARPVPALAWERGGSTVLWHPYRLGRTLHKRFIRA